MQSHFDPNPKRPRKDADYMAELIRTGVYHLSGLRQYAARPPGFYRADREAKKPPTERFRHYREHRVICTQDGGWVPSLRDFCCVAAAGLTPAAVRRMITRRLVNPMPEEVLDALIPYIRDHDVQELLLGYVYTIIGSTSTDVMLCHRNQDPETAKAWPERAVWFGRYKCKVREALCRNRDWDNPGLLVEWTDWHEGRRVMTHYVRRRKVGLFNGGLTVGLEARFDEYTHIRGITEVTEDPDKTFFTFSYGEDGALTGAKHVEAPIMGFWIQKGYLAKREDLVIEGEALFKRVSKEIEEYAAKERVQKCEICPKILSVFDSDEKQRLLTLEFDEVEAHGAELTGK